MSIMIKITQLTQELKGRFEIWWERLSLRDQRTAIILGLSLVILLVYSAIMLPLSSWSKHAKEQASRGYEDFLYMQNNLPLAKQLEGQQRAGQSLDPVNIVSSSAKQAGIVFSRVQPVRQGVSVWIDEVSYQSLLTWLLQLNAKALLNVKQIRLEKAGEDGFVKVFLRLGR